MILHWVKTNIEVKKKTKRNVTFVCLCALNFDDHIDLMITRMMESLTNLTNTLKISKIVTKPNKNVNFCSNIQTAR